MELDLDFVGDNAEVAPAAFSDAEVGALEAEGAVENGVTAFTFTMQMAR